jgi:diketogulonate reductase-like aldo/keto reductase
VVFCPANIAVAISLPRARASLPIGASLPSKTKRIAEKRGISAAQVALAWLIGRPGVTSVIMGARTDAQLQDNLKAAGVVLTSEERTRLDAASAPALLYPYWHQANTASDRLSPADLSLLGPHLKR